MDDDNIIDLQDRLRQCAAAGAETDELQGMVGVHYARCFQALAEQHGQSHAWATEKAAVATEIVTDIFHSRRTKYDFRFSIAGDVDSAQQAAIAELIHKSAKEFGTQIVEKCLEAFMRRAPELAMPDGRRS